MTYTRVTEVQVRLPRTHTSTSPRAEPDSKLKLHAVVKTTGGGYFVMSAYKVSSTGVSPPPPPPPPQPLSFSPEEKEFAGLDLFHLAAEASKKDG